MLAFRVLGFSNLVRSSYLALFALKNAILAEDKTKTVVNHNPLPDITHEDFVSILGPLLAPENYPPTPPTTTPTAPTYGSSSSLVPPPTSGTPRPSQSGPRPPLSPSLFNPNSPAPFDWLHFEGRSVKTTLSNITGIDGLARERKWRSHCVFSVDVGRRGRQGVEAVRWTLATFSALTIVL